MFNTQRSLNDFIEAAHSIAETSGAAFLRLEHLLVPILDDPDLDLLIHDLVEDDRALREELEERMDVIRRTDLNASGGPLYSFSYSRELPEITEDVIAAARHFARKGKFPEPSGLHIFLAISASRSELTSVLRRFGVTTSRLSKYLDGEIIRDEPRPTALDRLSQQIEKASRAAPEFRQVDGRLSYVQQNSKEIVYQSKQFVLEYLEPLYGHCKQKINYYPGLCRAVEKYLDSMRHLGRKNGAMRLYIDAAAVEAMAADAAHPVSDDDPPPLDREIRVALQSFMVAHASLMSLFPDVNRLADELTSYNQNTEAITELNRRLLQPSLQSLASAKNIFDHDTEFLNRQVCEQVVSTKHRAGGSEKAAAAVTHSWLRGALTGMGRIILSSTKTFAEEVAKEEAKGVSAGLSGLPASIFNYLQSSSRELITLANGAPKAFGWLRHLLELLNLVPRL